MKQQVLGTAPASRESPPTGNRLAFGNKKVRRPNQATLLWYDKFMPAIARFLGPVVGLNPAKGNMGIILQSETD